MKAKLHALQRNKLSHLVLLVLLSILWIPICHILNAQIIILFFVFLYLVHLIPPLSKK